jgi:hypothetical protein
MASNRVVSATRRVCVGTTALRVCSARTTNSVMPSQDRRFPHACRGQTPPTGLGPSQYWFRHPLKATRIAPASFAGIPASCAWGDRASAVRRQQPHSSTTGAESAERPCEQWPSRTLPHMRAGSGLLCSAARRPLERSQHVSAMGSASWGWYTRGG